MKICATSDLHGHLPPIPECDLLLIAGDLCPVSNHSIFRQMKWLNDEFRSWLEEIPAKKVVGIAGNHDFIFERNRDLVPNTLRWTYLQDSKIKIDGLLVFGAPWQPPFFDWAFNLPEEKLERKWSGIPNNVNVLITHGPPHGYGDVVPRRLTDDNETEWPEPEHVGSTTLAKRIKKLKNLKLHVFGHIHPGYGRYELDGKILANVSLVNEKYQPVNPVMEFEF